MKRPFHKTIRGRLVVTVLALILTLGLAISSVSYLLFDRNLRQTTIRSAETNLHLLGENINLQLTNITDFIQRCQSNDQIMQFLLTSRGSDRYSAVTYQASEILSNDYLSNSSQKYIQRLLIAGFDRTDYLQVVQTSYSVDKPLPSMIQELPYFQEAIDTPRLSQYHFIVKEEPFTKRAEQIIPVIRPIQSPYSSENIGYVFAVITMELFTDNTASYSLNDGTCLYLTIGESTFLLKDRQAVSITSDPAALHPVSLTQLRSDTSVHRLAAGGKEYYAVTAPIALNGCYITQTIPAAVFRSQFTQYFFLIALIFLAVAAAGLVLLFALSHTFTRPVQKLRNRISIIAGGDFTRDDTILWNNELGDMGRDINRLSHDIEELIERRVSYEKERMDYEYRLLQSQINPHFLYNTLNSIKWMATIQNATGIAEMTLALSRLLKNISKGTSTFVSIRQEFELLDDYFAIQKYRYGGMITMNYIIEEEALLDNEIPRFSLQPIVENAIFHGIEPAGRAGIIQIRLFAPDAQTVQVDVTDNGLGIEEEKLKRLLAEETPTEGSFFRNVGISNVHKRLQYTYGKSFGLCVKSEAGVYTTVSTLLPRKLADKEEPHDKAVDRG